MCSEEIGEPSIRDVGDRETKAASVNLGRTPDDGAVVVELVYESPFCYLTSAHSIAPFEGVISCWESLLAMVSLNQ